MKTDMTAPDRSADEIITRLYDELRILARAHLRRERVGHTLDTTGLVNEAYLRLSPQGGLGEMDRARFFATASVTMRRALVDYARQRNRIKRGAGGVAVPLDEVEGILSDVEAEEVLALDEALDRLEAVNPRGAQVVALGGAREGLEAGNPRGAQGVHHRVFAGLSLEETAELLDVSVKTVQRDWLTARAWLRKEVARDLGLMSRDP